MAFHPTNLHQVTVAIVVVAIVYLTPPIRAQLSEIPHQEVENWAWKFGHHLVELSKKITYLEEIRNKYSDTKIEKVNGTKLVQEMVADIEAMLKSKHQAVGRIIETAQQSMNGHEFDKDIEFPYFNAKEINEHKKIQMILKENKRFNNIPVNTSRSTIHVATNVYNKDVFVLNAISGTDYLDPTFASNYEQDPTLLWQYFGSVTGFLRNFPGVKWLVDEKETDIYDCRMRPWYIEAAASPKDMVILLDTSGSMTGLRQEIAKQVVSTLLDTLNANDFVAVLEFSDHVRSVVECFESMLVPANRQNIEDFKEQLEDLKAEKIANFTHALTMAFDILKTYNETGDSSQCNQAIMIVTDGSPDTYDEIFNQYNSPTRFVRVFTYLIGREVTEIKEVKEMACSNRGFFAHVKTPAEVREQVEKYIPVMSRPLVLHSFHTFIWTPVYADITDPKVSKWLYAMRERARKRARILRRMHENMYDDEVTHDMDSSSQEDRTESDIWHDEELFTNDYRFCESTKLSGSCESKYFQLMTTVAAPVFDLKNKVKVQKRILVNGTWIERTEEETRANLLGVAGTDVPIKEILKLAPPYKIGVNAYPFIITNNGHLLTHPDLRPMFGDLLKPDYSTVDFSEVELANSTFEPWEKPKPVMDLRKKMIDGEVGDWTMNIKVHYDKMKRVIARRNHYHFAPIADTPFSFGLALPKPYGEFKINSSGRLDSSASITNIISEFKMNAKWRIHPDWIYCTYRFPANRPEMSPEQNLLHFLDYLKQDVLKESPRVMPPLKEQNRENHFNNINQNKYYYCDKELLENFIADARATNVYGKQDTLPLDHGNNKNFDTTSTTCKISDEYAGFARKNGVTISFVATRSGLTRWDDLLTDEQLGNMTEPHFIHLHNRAIDEIWYKRAVDQNYINNDSFVFSVPFDAALQNDTYVTGSRAIFLKSHDVQVPVAVVGLQFKHSVFADVFFNYTSNCQSKTCATNCSSNDLDCYLLDDNGFVIVSEDYQHTGKFFGEVDGLIMQSLIVDGIYQGVRMYDFQAICQEAILTSSAASYILKPIHQVLLAMTWLWQKLALLWLQYNLYNWWNSDWLTISASNDDSNPVVKYIEQNEMFKMKYHSCNKNFTLYRLNPAQLKLKPLKAKLMKCNPNGCDSFWNDVADPDFNKSNFTHPKPFSVQQVPYTNLVLLAVDAICPCESSQSTSITPTEINYGNMSECDVKKTTYYRSRPKACYNYHPEELEINDCGRGSRLKISVAIIFISIAITMDGFLKSVQLWS